MNSPLRLILCLTLCATSTLVNAAAKITPDIVYGHKDGMALIYDMFEPEGEKNGAAIIYMVSGGWFSVWREPESRVSGFESFLDAGYTVFAVHHGSAPRFKVPEAYADVSRAVRHIRMNSDSYGIDDQRMGVTGGSAGGHLSLMLGLNGEGQDYNGTDPLEMTSSQVAAVVAYFPPVDLRRMTGPSERFPALDFPNEEAAGISPLLHVDPQDPPVLLIHGDADELVNISHSVNMYAELQKHNVASNFITIPGAAHGFRGDEAVQASAARLEWFNRYLLD